MNTPQGSKNPLPPSAPVNVLVKPKKRLIITLTSNPQRVNFSDIATFKKLTINFYSVKGAPTTGGVPDSSVYYLKLNTSNFPHSHWINTTGGASGVPLTLTGAFTTRDLSQPTVMLESPDSIAIDRSLFIDVRDSTGSTYAVFTEIVLLVEAE